MAGPGTSADRRPSPALRRLGLVAVGALVVVLMALVLPFAQQARWTRLCTEQGGRLERQVEDVEPLLAPRSRTRYVCYDPEGRVIDSW